MSNAFCDDTKMTELLTIITDQDNHVGIEVASKTIQEFPEDPRLHYLQGLMMIEVGDLTEAHKALSRAIEIDPDFAIARFQFGFFQLVSGDSFEALKTWARLYMLPDEHFLNRFVVGLRHLIHDEIADCITCLEEGIAANQEVLPLNKDMRMLIEEVRPLLKTDKNDPKEELSDDLKVSSTSFILNQFKDQRIH